MNGESSHGTGRGICRHDGWEGGGGEYGGGRVGGERGGVSNCISRDQSPSGNECCKSILSYSVSRL